MTTLLIAAALTGSFIASSLIVTATFIAKKLNQAGQTAEIKPTETEEIDLETQILDQISDEIQTLSWVDETHIEFEAGELDKMLEEYGLADCI